MSLNESIVEHTVLGWFGELGYAVGHGPPLALVKSPRFGSRRRDSRRPSLGGVVKVAHLLSAVI